MIGQLLKSLYQSPSTRVAVKFFDGVSWTQLSYFDLLNHVNAMRSRIGELANGSRTCWGLCVAPCLELPALILGLTLSSCPFIILDRTKIMTADWKDRLKKLGVRWVISDKILDAEYLKFETTLEVNRAEFSVLRRTGIEKDETADENYLYAITTSGSTGSPKVVRAPVESLYPNIQDFSRVLGITADDVIILSSPLTFDPSMVEFFLAPINCAQLVIVSELVRGCAVSIAQVAIESSVTFYQTTPSLFRLWPEKCRNQLLGPGSKLKSLILGGEPFPSFAEIKSWNPQGDIRIFNTYGITEISCWATLKQVWPSMHDVQEIDIGVPLGETSLKTENHEGLHHLFIGSSSRICAIGDETFGELKKHQPIFRQTGDLFKIVDGKYYFVCRSDWIVKRFGRKVDLSQIEQFAAQLGILCTVVAEKWRNLQLNRPQVECRVLMFVVDNGSSELNELLVKLKKLLPSHCWPDDVHHVDYLPLTSHGKIDKKQLVDKHSTTRGKNFARSTFAELWNFFTAGSYKCSESGGSGFVSSGGDSFNAVLLIGRLEQLGVDYSTDLLMKLLQDVTFEECIKCLSPDNVVSEREANISIIPSVQCATVNDSYSSATQICNSGVCFALKGRTWPMDLLPTNFTENQPMTISIRWKHNLRKCVDASPLGVMAEKCSGSSNFIIIGSHSGLVVVLETKTGKIISQTQLPDRVEASACLSNDLQSYYIGCYDGKIYNVCIATGSVIWAFASEDTVKATCLVYNLNIFFGSYDKNVYSITQNGDLIWRTAVGPVTVPVVPHKDTILAATLASTVVSLRVDSGAIVWSCRVGAPMFADLTLLASSEQTNVLICPVDGRMQLRDLQDFTEIAALKMTGSIFSSPVLLGFDSEDVLVADEVRLNRVRVSPTAAVLWTKTFACRIVATPFKFGRHAVVISIDGLVSLVKLSDGEITSVYKLPHEVFSSPIVIGSEIFVGCRDDNVYCLHIAC